MTDDGDDSRESDSGIPSYGKFSGEAHWDDVSEPAEDQAEKKQAAPKSVRPKADRTKDSLPPRKKGTKHRASPDDDGGNHDERKRDDDAPEGESVVSPGAGKVGKKSRRAVADTPAKETKQSRPKMPQPKNESTSFLFSEDDWDENDLSLPSYGRTGAPKPPSLPSTVPGVSRSRTAPPKESVSKKKVSPAVSDGKTPTGAVSPENVPSPRRDDSKTLPQHDREKIQRRTTEKKERSHAGKKSVSGTNAPLSPETASARSVEDSVGRFLEKTARNSSVPGTAPRKRAEDAAQEGRSHDETRKKSGPVSGSASPGMYPSIPPLPRRERLRWDPEKREYVRDPSTDRPAETHAAPNDDRDVPSKERKTSAKSAVNPVATPAGKHGAEKTARKKSAASPSESTSGKVKKSPNVASPFPPERSKLPKTPDNSGKSDEKHRELPRGSSLPQTMPEHGLPDERDVETPAEGFKKLPLTKTMLDSLEVARYSEPTPIQAGVIPSVLQGIDVLGQAQTGTGKTAAYLIPVIEGIEECEPGERPVALILVPTRELAVQVRDEAQKLSYGRNIRIVAAYGGKPIAKQITRLREGVDVVVGTPGRIKDLMKRRVLLFEQLRWAVLDEADRMLDIGFRPDIEMILAQTPASRQTLLFSATMPPQVVKLAKKYMRNPEILDFSSTNLAVDTIDQYYVTVDQMRKFDALVHLLKQEQPRQAIIFCRTKRGADRLGRMLQTRFSEIATIHGDLQQTHRDRVMARFRSGTLTFLVATDVVGRGIDVSGISHIINYDIPSFCDDYVHRVGRTGRMGREGVAYTFVTAEEGTELTRIEMRINRLLERAELKGFEAFAKPTDSSVTDPFGPTAAKPVFGKPTRKIRRAL